MLISRIKPLSQIVKIWYTIVSEVETVAFMTKFFDERKENSCKEVKQMKKLFKGIVLCFIIGLLIKLLRPPKRKVMADEIEVDAEILEDVETDSLVVVDELNGEDMVAIEEVAEISEEAEEDIAVEEIQVAEETIEVEEAPVEEEVLVVEEVPEVEEVPVEEEAPVEEEVLEAEEIQVVEETIEVEEPPAVVEEISVIQEIPVVEEVLMVDSIDFFEEQLVKDLCTRKKIRHAEFLSFESHLGWDETLWADAERRHAEGEITDIVFVYSREEALKLDYTIDVIIAWPSAVSQGIVEGINDANINLLDFDLPSPLQVEHLVDYWQQANELWHEISAEIRVFIKQTAQAMYNREMWNQQRMTRQLFPGRLDRINALIQNRDMSGFDLITFNEIFNTEMTINDLSSWSITEEDVKNDPFRVGRQIAYLLSGEELRSADPENILNST